MTNMGGDIPENKKFRRPGKILKFWLGMAIVFILAYLKPEWAARGGILKSEWTSLVAIFAIFFMQGMSLNLHAIRLSLKKVSCHIFVLIYIFVFSPVLALWMLRFSGHWLSFGDITGMIYLSLLPTTITSCLIFTQLSGGNVVISAVNVVIANIFGIFYTSASLSVFFVVVRHYHMPVIPVIIKLICLIVLPMGLGIGFQKLKRFRCFLTRRRERFSLLCVLYILLCALSSSANQLRTVFNGDQSCYALGVRILLVLIFLLALHGINWLISSYLGYTREERIAVLFTGSQKTLAMGLPMSSVFFSPTILLQLNIHLIEVLLPLLIYHPLQLILGSFLVGVFKQKH